VCAFCADKQLEIDYKQPDLLWRYLTSRGKIRPRRQTGSCAKHQRRLSVAIKRARHLALIPFVAEYPRSN
jgi:small subunit ribosomal protein S18